MNYFKDNLTQNHPFFIHHENIADYAKESVGILLNAKIINGFEDGTFRPDNNISRVEFIHVIGMMNKWNILIFLSVISILAPILDFHLT